MCLASLHLLTKLKGLTFALDYFLKYGSVPLALFVMLLSFKVWQILVHPDLKRMLFSRDYTLNIDVCNAKKALEVNEAFVMKRISGRVEKNSPMDKQYFMVVEGLTYLSLKRSIAGGLYCMLDRYYTFNERYFRTSLSIKIIVPTLILFLAGYSPSADDFGGRHVFEIIRLFCLSIPCLVVGSSLIPAPHNQLLPIGRSDHFKKSFLSWLIKPLTIIVWLSLILLFSRMLENHMPDLTLPDYHLRYHSLKPYLILWTLVIIPVADTFMYYFENPCSVITMILVVLILLFLSLFSLFTVNAEYRAISMTLSILLANGFLIDRLARYWFKKDIVSFI